MKRIVVGYDGSPEATRALERAAALATALGAAVTVASVSPVTGTGGRAMGPYDPTDSPEKHESEVEEAAAKLAKSGIEAEVVSGTGKAAASIVSVAKDRDADLIVVGGRDLNALARLFGASVSDSVAHHAECDVLIVH
jgi:nucleotide-binding universal stress UspA family protein